jgi:hypothetical protein
MASQRILLLAIGGLLAERVWQDICRWSDARTATIENELSPDDWPLDTRQEIDTFVAKMVASGFAPPILYRSEHVDCWSMGDVFETALVKQHPDYCRQLYTTNHELIGTWVYCSERISPDHDARPETHWLYCRVNEAIAAWGDLVDRRLIVLARSVLGGLRTDDEVIDSLATVPTWWTVTETPAR